MKYICYFLIYAFEQFVSFSYFNGLFKRKQNNKNLFLLYLLSFTVQFSLYFLNMPILNLVSFFIMNLIIVCVGYKSNIKQILFSVILLEALMISSELVVIHAISAILNTEILSYTSNNAILLFETLTTKTLYFLVVYITTILFAVKNSNQKQWDISYLLLFLPVVSITIFVFFTYLDFSIKLPNRMISAFLPVSFSLLFANIIVFLVHEKMKANLEEKQNEKINEEYYSDLQKQYDTSNILVHDIKKHLYTIRDLAVENNDKAIAGYIDSIYESNEIKSIKNYSSNKLVNVIARRYAQLCTENKIDFYCDIRDIDFSFISNSEITAILDNLLENAFEASLNAKRKCIELKIDIINENFVLINTVNYCQTAPEFFNSYPISTKKNKTLHGIGIKSIEKTVNKNGGNTSYKYDDKKMKFEVSVILKIN